MSRKRSPRILVVGLGGIGGIISAHLQKQNCELLGITTNPKILQRLKSHGFSLNDGGLDAQKGSFYESGQSQRNSVSVGSFAPPGAKFDYIFLATQPPQVEAAAHSVWPCLADDGAFVCFQNGLIESRLAQTYGAEKVIGAIIAWGASMPEPGVYERTSTGGFTVGRIQGEPDRLVQKLVPLLSSIGPVTMTNNLMGARWSKLAINCAISTLGTISAQRLGALLQHRYARRLALEIMTETVAVAHAEGIELIKVAGTLDLNWLALTEKEAWATASLSLWLKHTILTLVGLKYRRLRSSMLNAIERGRPPSVDFLNGEVVSRAKRLGISTPINLAVLDAVHSIARKEASSSLEHLSTLYESTRLSRVIAMV